MHVMKEKEKREKREGRSTFGARARAGADPWKMGSWWWNDTKRKGNKRYLIKVQEVPNPSKKSYPSK